MNTSSKIPVTQSELWIIIYYVFWNMEYLIVRSKFNICENFSFFTGCLSLLTIPAYVLFSMFKLINVEELWESANSGVWRPSSSPRSDWPGRCSVSQEENMSALIWRFWRIPNIIIVLCSISLCSSAQRDQRLSACSL